jgi:hypothetical protein
LRQTDTSTKEIFQDKSSSQSLSMSVDLRKNKNLHIKSRMFSWYYINKSKLKSNLADNIFLFLIDENIQNNMNVFILFLIIIINHINSPIREDMNLTLKLVFLVLLVTIPTHCQLPEDDEVTTAIPGYNHPIYSGTSCIII